MSLLLLGKKYRGNMVYWKIEFSPKADKDLEKIDHTSKKEIRNYLNKRVLKLEHPKQVGKPLRKDLKGLWRYRIGKFRIICDIQEDKLIILVIKIGERDGVYYSD